MLGEISSTDFLEWKIYEELEPFAAERADYHAAHIVQAITRMDKPLRDFLLPFGDAVYATQAQVIQQSVEQQEFLLKSWIWGSNAVFEAAAKKGR